MDNKQKEEIKKYQKMLEDKNSVIHSLEKKLQKFEEAQNRILSDLEQKRNELSETFGVNNLNINFVYQLNIEK